MSKKELWGSYKGKDVYLYHLVAGEYKATVSNYGAILTHFFVPDANGNIADIVLGCDHLEDYINYSPYFGATVGRFGNWIKNGQITINGKSYQLTQNDGKNQLHGGFYSFDKQIWDAQTYDVENGQALELTYISKDGEEGYPGTLTATVTYTLLSDGRLIFDTKAISDKDTICSIINHSYFNLFGQNDIRFHRLQIDADSYTEVEDGLIPTGKLLPVENTGLDFRKLRMLSEAMAAMPNQSYDHNLALNGKIGELRKVATLIDDESGRKLTVHTTLPGIQIYNSAGMGNSAIIGKNGVIYPDFAGLCLETQFFPNSPNIAHFDQPSLKAGDIWHHQTIFQCS